MRKAVSIFARLLLLALLLPGTLGVVAADAVTPPLKMVRSASDTVLGRVIADKALIEKDRAHVLGLINEILIPHIDDRTMARRVLGKTWETASEAQRASFTREFRRYMVRFYGQVLLLYSGEKVEYSSVEQASQPDVRKISSLISRSGEVPIEAAYRTELRSDEWMVTDILVDGISMVHANQTQFKYLITRDGLEKVTSMLETRNDRPFR
ncbi:MAG: ABC transporter substrate-binding protein [Sulfuriflexus sp.]|nr:ABC transporter substrate-binding protein [Sulfuriflexus sp.]